MLETRLIRAVRARQEAAVGDELAELVVELFPDLLMDALKQPEVRAAIRAIAASRASATPATPPPAARRSAARGGRRV